jgi:hypothetical protein
MSNFIMYVNLGEERDSPLFLNVRSIKIILLVNLVAEEAR